MNGGGNRVSITRRGRDLLWGPPTLLSSGHRGIYSGFEQAGRESNDSLSGRAEAKNIWRYSSSSLHDATKQYIRQQRGKLSSYKQVSSLNWHMSIIPNYRWMWEGLQVMELLVFRILDIERGLWHWMGRNKLGVRAHVHELKHLNTKILSEYCSLFTCYHTPRNALIISFII
jgi:hypothetical protein